MIKWKSLPSYDGTVKQVLSVNRCLWKLAYRYEVTVVHGIREGKINHILPFEVCHCCVVVTIISYIEGCGVGVGVSHLKETSITGHICFTWTLVWFCCSLFDFCAINFTTKTLFVHLLLEELKISVKSSILKYTIRVWFWVRKQSRSPTKNKDFASLATHVILIIFLLCVLAIVILVNKDSQNNGLNSYRA